MTQGPQRSPRGRACDRCLARSWLLERLGAHLERVRPRWAEVLMLDDEELIEALGGAHSNALRRELAQLDGNRAAQRASGTPLARICRCDPDYPSRLRGLEPAPAVLHVTGGLDRLLGLAAVEPVAVVGSRRASSYGMEVARSLARDLAWAGVPVVSGMALGIDSAAHAGALLAGGLTIAVLPAGVQRAYPPAKRALHAQIISTGAAVSELPGMTPGVWRWMFPARNRIIAALGAMTVVVEAREHSGALLTAAWAGELGRPVGAVPGRVGSPTACGTNELLAAGAHVVRGAQDVLDRLYGAGARTVRGAPRPQLAPEQSALLAAIEDGHDTPGALEQAGFPAEHGLTLLASLELSGHVRREPGGRFSVIS